MILHLLLAALALGQEFGGNLAENRTSGSDVASQGNLTAANRTLVVPTASGGGGADVSRDAARLSNLTETLEAEERGNLTTEDDEDFQEKQDSLSPSGCQRRDMVGLFHKHCGEHFHQDMTEIRDSCTMKDVLRPYNLLSLCLEIVADKVGCFHPNPDTQDFLVEIHSTFFSNCSQEEGEEMEDAPRWLVLVLTLAPMALFPVLVYLAVWKSKVRE